MTCHHQLPIEFYARNTYDMKLPHLNMFVQEQFCEKIRTFREKILDFAKSYLDYSSQEYSANNFSLFKLIKVSNKSYRSQKL